MIQLTQSPLRKSGSTKENLTSPQKGDQSDEDELNPNTGQRTSSSIRVKPIWMAEYDL